MISNQIQSQNAQSALEPQLVQYPQQPLVNKRLMIERVVLENFKSYFGRKEIGPLHKCFSAVVGPNGSGKSNLIESLLFVFGKKAKRMRLNKLSELIHNSAEHQEVTHTTVRVYFQDIYDHEEDPDYFEVVPDSRIEVARSVDKKSVSKYFINGMETSFKSVCQLLNEKGIDLEHNRFLILQGEVEQISLMKPKAQNQNETGLLEYLEDIIGSNKYVDDIAKLELALDGKNEDRMEKQNRKKVAEGELKNLQEEHDLAVDYLQQERKFMVLNNLSLFVDLGKGIENMNSAVKAIEEKKEEARKVREQKKEQMEQNKELVTKINVIMGNEEKFDKKYEESKAEFNNLEKSDMLLRNEMKQNIQKIKKTDENSEGLAKKREALIEESFQIEKVLPTKEKDFKSAKEQKSEKEKEFEQIEMKVREKTEKLRKEKEKLESQHLPLQGEFKQLKESIELKKQEIGTIKGKAEKIEQDISSLQNQFEENKAKLALAKESQVKHQQTLAEWERNLKANEEEHQNLNNQILKVEREKQQQSEKLNVMVHSKNDLNQKNKIITELTAAQKRGQLSGLHGRLGDLGTIDLKFDCAITTACGALDNIVVDTIEQGEKCLQFLRENKVGRANLICLDKMAQYQDGRIRPFQAPEGSQRLFDIVNIKDEKFSNAFYFALRNTLVCENLDVATKIAYGQQRQRVVTLTGDLIEQSGMMSGGGKPKKGGMSDRIVEEYSEQQIASGQEEVQKLSEMISQLKEKHNEYQKKKIEMERGRQSADATYRKNLIEVRAFDDFGAQFQKKLEQYMKEKEKALAGQEQVQKLGNEIDEESNFLAQLSPQIESLKKQIHALESQILEEGGDDYKQQKKELDQVVAKVTELDKIITRMKASMENVGPNVLKIDKEIEEEKNQKKKLEENNRQLKIQIEKNDEAGQKLLAEMKVIDQQRGDNKAELDALKSNFNQLKRDLQSIEDEETKAKEKVQDAIKKKTEFEDQCKQIKSRIKKNRDQYRRQQEEFGDLFNWNEQNEVEASGKRLRKQEGGYLYHLECTSISYNFRDEEIEVLKSESDAIKNHMMSIKNDIENKNPNINVIKTYQQKLKDFKEKESLLQQVEHEMNEAKTSRDELKKRRHDEFILGFNVISQKLKEMYRLITNGGDAELETLDALDPFSEGIQFQVRPLKKSWKQMSKLSGGEKTLSSLSLIFALHHYKPSPLYCMDEIDAALDYKNVAIVGNYIKKRARNSQFLIISLRNNMFELSDKLIGIYKTFDITKTVTINPNQMKTLIQKKQENQENKDQNAQVQA